MASSEHADDLATCPECGGTAMSSETPCSRCQDPQQDAYTDDQCQYCGAYVSQRYRRVSGDNNDIAHACPTCTTGREITNGAAANPDHVPDEIQQGHATIDEVTQR